jgi:hypothetical protein
MTDLFYNTINETGEKLAESKLKVASQEEQILRYFYDHPNINATPSEVGEYFTTYLFNWPITSIRRAMTNLTNKGKLEKTDRQVEGPYGHKEFLWKLKGE